MDNHQWLIELVDEYGQPPGRRLQRLITIFGREERTTMETAVFQYMLEKRFFPRVAELAVYVDAAKAQKKTAQRTDWFTDDDLLNFEIMRGTMRPLSEINAEIAAARDQLRANPRYAQLTAQILTEEENYEIAMA